MSTTTTSVAGAARPAAPGSGALERFTRWLDLRKGEWRTVLLLAFAAFSVICSYSLLSPASKSLFLVSHEALDLRYAYIYVGVFTAAVGTLYAHLSRGVRTLPLVNAVLLVLGLAIVAFRLAAGSGVNAGFLAYVFYVFVNAYGVLATAMFWLAVNHVMGPRQARRLLGYIGAGANAGGIAGGYLVSAFVKQVGTVNLLWGGLAMLIVCIVTLNVVFARRPPMVEAKVRGRSETAGTFKLIVTHPYLRVLTGLVAIIMLCATLSDYQFNWAVKEYVGTHVADMAGMTAEAIKAARGDEMSKYFGFWRSTMSLICLPTQLLITGPLLRRFGVGPALLFLPIAMFGMAAGMGFWPSLAFGTALEVSDGALRYSVNKSALELLYLPLPLWIKNRTKVVIDTAVDRLAKAGTGLLLSLLVVLHFADIRFVAALTALLTLVWMAWAMLLRKRYVDVFRDALDRGVVDLSSERIRLDEPAAMGAVALSLADDSPSVVKQALDVLLSAEDVGVSRVADRLSRLAVSEDPEIAHRALRLLARLASPGAVAVAERRLLDADARVGGAAAGVLLAASHRTAPDFIADLAARGPEAEWHAAGALLSAGREVPDDVLQRLLADFTPAANEARRAFAEALSRGDLPQHRELLRRLIADPETEVATAALRGAGNLKDPALVPFLVTEIRRPSRRSASRDALAAMGPDVLPALETYLWDARLERRVRERLPRAIGQIGTDAAHQILLRGLSMEDPGLRHQVLKGLNRMAQHDKGYHVPDEVLDSEILAECHYLARLLALAAQPGKGGPLRRLYARAVGDSVRYARERAFRLLGLRGQGRDWANAFAGLVGEDARLRASAVEFADGTLPDRLRRIVVPLIDDIGAADALHRVGRHLEIEHLTIEEAYVAAARGPEPWLAACALFAASEEGVVAVAAVAEERKDDEDPWVRDAAGLLLARAGGDGQAAPAGEPA